jgi:RecA-family ATPase
MDYKPVLIIPKPMSALSAEQIMEMELPPQRHLVKGIIAVGCNLLAGKPKIGKSWLALQLAISVSLGKPLFGSIAVEKKGVLYLALEDNIRRIKKRLSRMLKESEHLSNLSFQIDCPRASAGGLATLREFLQSHPDVGLIIIDTLARFRDVPRSNKNSYLEDYGAISNLKKIADEHQITILIIHHLRKFDNTEDPLDNISGTTGISGATDANIVLARDRKSYSATMYVEGRDVERQEIGLKFDRDTVSWCLTSSIEKLNPERREIATLLQKAKEENKTMSPKEIADALGKKGEAIRQLLLKMVDDGDIECVGRGAYTIPDNNNNNDHNDNN